MMFRQTWIHAAVRKYQLILWRESPADLVQVYELTTHTYGLYSSPFVAIRYLLQLAEDEGERYLRAANILRAISYVNDLNGSADTIEEVRILKTELINRMSTAGYELLDDLPLDHMELPKPNPV
ncbi:unnamed protein product [Parnassius mnemosyne]|uniref:Uncharacterized protein n=1 Tax=Parnassius mnemosyne TaxID=213953 RepID=A0AAV1KK31_9NEOP